MAFTVVTNTSFQGGNPTSHTVGLPNGSNVSGRLVVIVFACDGTPTASWPLGWTDLVQGNGTGVHIAVGYRFIDGTEGFSGSNDTITVTTSAPERSNHHSYLISEGHASTPPEAAAPDFGSGSTTDPPSLTPSWGSDANLWIAASALRFSGDHTAAPTNYTDLLSLNNGDANAPLGTARRELTAATENPGTFSHNGGTVNWVTTTIAVQPGVAGIDGALAETQDDQTLAASGQLGLSGALDETQDSQTLAASGQLGLTGALAETQDDQTLAASGTVETTFDPLNAAVNIVGTTAELTWDASPTPGVADYSVFRRTGHSGTPFDPEVDVPIATGIATTSYDDEGLAADDYEWQVFGRVVT